MTPEVITLCGSTRFKDLFDEWNKKLTLEGNAVFSCGCWFQKTGEEKGLPEVDEETKRRLDEVHKIKILHSDSIFVLNPGGYIGESTKSEIEFAKRWGKKVRYLEGVTDA